LVDGCIDSGEIRRRAGVRVMEYDINYERARELMIKLPTSDIKLITDALEGRNTDAFVRGFLSGGYEIHPTVVRSTPDTYKSQMSLKIAFLQDMLESDNMGMIEIEEAFEQAKEEYRKTIEDDE